MTTFVALVAVLVVGPAHATIISGLNGTGLNWSGTAAPATPDANWDIVALPSSFTTGTQSVPYPAWIFSGGNPPFNIPNWLGGTGNSGTNGYHWIGARANKSESLIASGTVNQFYSMIYATRFQSSAAATVSFSFDVSVDNRALVFINGSITGTNTDQPTIAGGTPIGGLIWNNPPPSGTRAFSILQNVSGTAAVVSGTNTLYVVVQDYITTGTTFGSTGLLVANPVPEPSTCALGLAAIAFGTWRAWRRRTNRGS